MNNRAYSLVKEKEHKAEHTATSSKFNLSFYKMEFCEMHNKKENENIQNGWHSSKSI